MNEGILLNAALTFAGAAGYLAILERALHAPRTPARDATALFVFAVGAHLFLASLRQVVAYASQTAPALVALDATLFRIVSVVGALGVIPLVMLAAEAAYERGIALGLGWTLAIVSAFGLTLFLAGEITGPHASAWGSDWQIVDAGTRTLVPLAVGLPAMLAAVLLHTTSSQFPDPQGSQGRRLAIAAMVYYLAMVPDAMGLEGLTFLGARAVAAASALVAWTALSRVAPAPPATPRPTLLSGPR